jgi:hypothetical protein
MALAAARSQRQAIMGASSARCSTMWAVRAVMFSGDGAESSQQRPRHRRREWLGRAGVIPFDGDHEAGFKRTHAEFVGCLRCA